MRARLTFGISTGLVALCLAVLAALGPAPPRPLQAGLRTLPAVAGPWRGEERFFPEKVDALLRADDTLLRAYTAPGQPPAWLYVAYWGRQADGMAAHSPKLCYPGAGWLPIEQTTETLHLPGGKRIPVNRMLFQKGAAKEVVLYWYQTGSRVVTSEYLGKFWLVIDTLWNRRSDVAFVRVSSETQGDPAAATQRLRDLLQHLVPRLDAVLPS
ncbi:MAG: exosortase C-terminal domain/associated protein EpsI [Candidatus Methylomirabilales bacterium]